MLSRVEVLRRILSCPLDYLHPQRGVVPAVFAGEQASAVLNQALLRGLALSNPDPRQITLSAWADRWVAHWSRLPAVARLMGVQLAGPQLARGARIRTLDQPSRAFSRIALGPRTQVMLGDEHELEQSLDALGLAALVAWHRYIPEALMQRLPLLFSPHVVQLQQGLPVQLPNASLFILAVQHARIH